MFYWDVLMKLSSRKRRVLAVASCRRLLPFLEPGDEMDALEVAERHADRLATRQQLAQVRHAAQQVVETLDHRLPRWTSLEPKDAAYRRVEARVFAAAAVYQTTYARITHGVFGSICCTLMSAFPEDADALPHWQEQQALLSEVAAPEGVVFEPRWRTGITLSLAQAAYAGDWDLLPVLADALEDLNCTEGRLLHHLRLPGPHVKGCWPVDLVLNRR
jgi:hypothetical protein